MTITEHEDWFEVTANDGRSTKFWFDQNPSRRAISGKPNKKQALQDARAYAGKGYVMVPRT